VGYKFELALPYSSLNDTVAPLPGSVWGFDMTLNDYNITTMNIQTLWTPETSFCIHLLVIIACYGDLYFERDLQLCAQLVGSNCVVQSVIQEQSSVFQNAAIQNAEFSQSNITFGDNLQVIGNLSLYESNIFISGNLLLVPNSTLSISITSGGQSVIVDKCVTLAGDLYLNLTQPQLGTTYNLINSSCINGQFNSITVSANDSNCLIYSTQTTTTPNTLVITFSAFDQCNYQLKVIVSSVAVCLFVLLIVGASILIYYRKKLYSSKMDSIKQASAAG